MIETGGTIKKAIIMVCILLISIGLCGCINDGKEDYVLFRKELNLNSAWEGVSDEENPISEPAEFMELNFSKNDYTNITRVSKFDKITQTWETEEQDGYPYNQYRFNKNQSVDELLLKWKGHGSQPFMKNIEKKVKILLYNFKASRWDLKCSIDCTEKEKYKKHEIHIPEISKYFNEQDNIYVLILGPYGAGDSTSILYTEYIELFGE